MTNNRGEGIEEPPAESKPAGISLKVGSMENTGRHSYFSEYKLPYRDLPGFRFSRFYRPVRHGKAVLAI
ncbi:unnamed protein product [Linum trigynum]|uniref:Uncharacterized protein n=1 Tax=Linum trigynum TaxID=586398 RepID=A0AAV2F5C4_9ROSI